MHYEGGMNFDVCIFAEMEGHVAETDQAADHENKESYACSTNLPCAEYFYCFPYQIFCPSK